MSTTYYNLRNSNNFFQSKVRSVNNGTESVRFKGPQLWQMLPPRYKIHNPFVSLNDTKLEWRKLSVQVMQRFYSELGPL